MAEEEEYPHSQRRNAHSPMPKHDLSADNSFPDDDHHDHQDHELDSKLQDDSEIHPSHISLPVSPLPPAPSTDDSSLIYTQPERSDDIEPLDEHEMQKHLNDVESSFLPNLSTIDTQGKGGVDDTYLFDGAQLPPNRGLFDGARSPSKNTQRNAPSVVDEADEREMPSSPPTPAGAYQTPAPMRHQVDDDSIGEVGNTTSSLETMSSSPTTAAAARTISRVISMSSAGQLGHEDLEDENTSASLEAEDPTASLDDEMVDFEATPRKPKYGSPQQSLDTSTDLGGDAGRTPGISLMRHSSGRRPKFLRSRHASQRSSTSSFMTNESQDGSEATVGADYALQSGGAAPAAGASRNSSMALARSVSLGSMASGIDDSQGSVNVSRQPSEAALATLTEEEQNRGRGTLDEVLDGPSPPETPRARSQALAAPTDTIIARHVRNVQVPESLAKEYRNQNDAASPTKRSGFTVSTMGRNGKNLTLKEQSSTIERLSKENFDLKLKVMFLSDRLDKLSEEGVKEMISENVELKTGLAVMQRDNKALKRRVRELEKQLKDDEGRPTTSQSNNSAGASPKWFDAEGAQEREEELIYLRERMEEYVTEIERLKHESMTRENEKRNLAEVVRSMGERRGQDFDMREEMDVWKDLLEQETSRREQADEDNKRLREEMSRLKSDSMSTGSNAGLSHTTHIYNISKRRQDPDSRPRSGLSNRDQFSSASTQVDQYKMETERLQHENAELRREVGAQTSMLTSRNREKERLYQEIEDLKLLQRRGGSIAGESILERSASRAHERSHSRASGGSRQATVVMEDPEREDFENKNSELRDKINELKINNQDLQRELESCMEDFEKTVEQKNQAELQVAELQEALEATEDDLVTMQGERDEALHGQEDGELMFESLRKEAQDELDAFAAESDEAAAEIERLQVELADSTENFNALQIEMRELSEGVIRLEDDQQNNIRRIQALEKELEDANRELEQMEKSLVEANTKISRFQVQQESSQGEIAFLREEQDGDKIKIGDLEAALRNVEQSFKDERDRTKELDQLLASERHQRDVVAKKEKQEVQQIVNDLNREASGAKDEARKLRKSLTSREVEAAEWKQRLMELESNLREALGDLNGTRSSLLNSIAKLQRELESTMRDKDNTKALLVEKERMIKGRDERLETHGLELQKLTEQLEKERTNHRNTKHQYETFQRTSTHTSRTLTQQEARVIELETSRTHDRRSLALLENRFKDQLTERNNLLLILWNRLSALCGEDWTHNNKLINGRALPSLEAVSTMLPGFSKNLLAAIKTIENLVGDFKNSIRSVERDLWKEYQTLESNLELRTKRLDRLETMTRSAIPNNTDTDAKLEMMRLRDANRGLKAELSSVRAASEARDGYYASTGASAGGSPAPAVPTGPRNRTLDLSKTKIPLLSMPSSTSLARQRTATANATASSSSRDNTTLETTLDRTTSSMSRAGTSAGQQTSGSGGTNEDEYKPDLRWQIRLQELEYKLKAEREARKLDRNSARQRLEEKSRENAELLVQVEQGKIRGGR